MEYKTGTTPKLRFLLSGGAGVTIGTIVIKLAKQDGTEFTGLGIVTEVGNGLYDYAASATDTDQVGMLSLMPVVSGTADTPMAFEIVSHTRAEVMTSIGALTAPDNAGIAAIKVKTDNLPGSPAATGAAMTLAPGERDAIAVEVESHLLDEGDSQMLINAIVGAIGNTNLSEASVVAAIRADLERAGGFLDIILANTGTTIPGLISALNDYDGSDTAGVESLLARLTAVRAGYLDELAGLDVQASAAAALTAYDPPTRAEVTADKEEIITQGDAEWATGTGGGAGGSGLSEAAIEAIEGADQILLAELHKPESEPSTPHVIVPTDDGSDTVPTVSLTG